VVNLECFRDISLISFFKDDTWQIIAEVKKVNLKKVTEFFVYCYEKCTKILFKFLYEIYIFKITFSLKLRKSKP